MSVVIEKVDLSLNRSLEELISSYWEAINAGVDDKSESLDDFYTLEDYLSNFGAI